MDTSGFSLVQAVVLLGAATIAVPLFRRLGLGSVLGYLAAGLAVGPFGLGLISSPQTLLHTAELGVVMFLFIIGLEMRPSKLWTLRRQIFGLGVAQVATCGILLTLVAMAAGVTFPVAVVGAMGFVLSSTAVIMQLLQEQTHHGQGQGVEAARTIQDQVADAVAHFGQDRRFAAAHASASRRYSLMIAEKSRPPWPCRLKLWYSCWAAAPSRR